MENNRPLGWTTLEEAKLLVDAGFDPNTADMYYEYIQFDNYILSCRDYSKEEENAFDALMSIYGTESPTDFYPCWSLGALEKLIPDDIKVNDVTFFYHASYDGIRKWSSSYTDEDLHRLILFNSFTKRIEMLVQTVLFLLENNHIKKQE